MCWICSPLFFLYLPGLWDSRVHRPWGDSSSGLREAGGLVGHGYHPVWVPGGLCAILWRHSRRAFWTSYYRWALNHTQLTISAFTVHSSSKMQPFFFFLPNSMHIKHVMLWCELSSDLALLLIQWYFFLLLWWLSTFAAERAHYLNSYLSNCFKRRPFLSSTSHWHFSVFVVSDRRYSLARGRWRLARRCPGPHLRPVADQPSCEVGYRY